MLFRASPAEGMKLINNSLIKIFKNYSLYSLPVVMVPKAVCTYISEYFAGISEHPPSSEI